MTINLLAPSAATGSQFICRSGNIYSTDANAVVKNVAFNDVLDLTAQGCISLGQSAGRSNFTATTNPGVTNDNTQDYVIGSSWFNKSTGIEYRATSVATGAATWVAIGSASALGLPLVAGRFYGIPQGSTQAAVLTVLGTLYAYPIFIPSATTLATLSLGSTTGQTGGKGRFALFYDSAGYPGAIVAGTDSGDLAATSTAVATSSALTIALAAGWYWVGSIFTASSTMPSVTGITAIYANSLNSLIGSDTAAHALTVSAQAASGISVGTQTYPATNMATSFPTFPLSATVTLNATTPVAILGV